MNVREGNKATIKLSSNYTNFLPNGVSASETILKCCFAHGRPIMVMANSTPNKRCVRAIQIPPIIHHIKFITVDRHPGA